MPFNFFVQYLVKSGIFQRNIIKAQTDVKPGRLLKSLKHTKYKLSFGEICYQLICYYQEIF